METSGNYIGRKVLLSSSPANQVSIELAQAIELNSSTKDLTDWSQSKRGLDKKSLQVCEDHRGQQGKSQENCSHFVYSELPLYVKLCVVWLLVFIPIFQMRNLRPREIIQLGQDHIAKRRGCQLYITWDVE